MKKVALIALFAVALTGVAFAQLNTNQPAAVKSGQWDWSQGKVVQAGQPDYGSVIWDNYSIWAWWSGVTDGYINLDWGKMPTTASLMPDHVVDGFLFAYGTNNMDPAGEDFAVFYFDSTTGFGNIGVQETGLLFTGLPNGAYLPTLLPGWGWIWTIQVDLEGSGYEFLVNQDMGFGMARMTTPTMGSTGLSLASWVPTAGTQNVFDIYYPNGTYNGSWWFGTLPAWASWTGQLDGSEGGADMTFYGQGSQGNDVGLYAEGDFATTGALHFMLRANLQTMAGVLLASTQTMSTYIPSLDITRLVGNFAGGSPFNMGQLFTGDFWVYDLAVPPQYMGVTAFFQGVLDDAPLQQPPVDASQGLRAN